MKKVYVMKRGAHYKIGVADDVDKRMKSLSTGGSLPISCRYVIHTSQAHAAEKFLHKRYNGFRIYGEWFNLNKPQLLELSVASECFCMDDWMEHVGRRGEISYKALRLACSNYLKMFRPTFEQGTNVVHHRFGRGTVQDWRFQEDKNEALELVSVHFMEAGSKWLEVQWSGLSV